MSKIINLDNLGDWSICHEVFGWILANVQEGGTILELGFGKGTRELLNAGYIVYSVEHDPVFVEKAKEIVGNNKSHTLIHAPLLNLEENKPGHWYDLSVVTDIFQSLHYDLLIIDGPDTNNRHHMLKVAQLFSKTCSVIVDDYCEIYETAKIGAYFALNNGVVCHPLHYKDKSALCIKGRGK